MQVQTGGAGPAPHPSSFPPTPQEIDEYITQARDKSYETMMRVGKRGLNLAANAAVTAAAKVRQGHTQTPRAPACSAGPQGREGLWLVQLRVPCLALCPPAK